MTAASIVLGAEVSALSVIVQTSGQTSFALDVTDAAGAPADLTGLVATIETHAGDTWRATVVGAKFTWTITPEQAAALTYATSRAVLVVTAADGERVVWARGRADVRK